MADLFELESLGLVEKISSELKNHLGISDRTLAEFIIAQRLESNSFETFQHKVIEAGGEVFSSSLLKSIDKFIRMMHPSMRTEAPTVHHETDELALFERKAQDFSDSRDKIPVQESANDTIKDLEVLESESRRRKPSNRKRDRSRSQDRSLELRKKRYDENDHDEGQVHHQRRHYEHRESSRKSRQLPLEVDDNPILNKIYEGCVTGIKDFGVFVNLFGIRRKATGLVHVSQMANVRVNHPSDLVEYDQPVKVKIIGIEGTKIRLSMKDINQETGEDLAQVNFASDANLQALGRGRKGHTNSEPQPTKQERRRMTTPEKWEIRQLIASGVVKASDYPDLDEDYDVTLRENNESNLEQDVDIEVRDEEPPFLSGLKKQSFELSPIRIIKVPEGSMNRAAISGTALLKDRKELQRQEADAAIDEQQAVDLSTQWNDPMVDPDQRKFAADLKSVQVNKPSNNSQWKQVVQRKNKSFGAREKMTIKQQRESLPIYALRDSLIKAVQQHQILVVVGETGSGKTTQTTQYLAEAGFTNSGIIGCTQPRRVAAISVAKRVAEEVGCVLGEEVGYSIRFEDHTSPATKIKYMTDGMLQREILQDPELKRYSVIMLDEAHERTIATDILFALLKKALKKRSDLKVIVTSATLNAEKFSYYFNAAPIFTIPGRTFPVEIFYTQEPESDYLDAALITVLQIHLTQPYGDILLFLTGQEEIDTSCEVLKERMKALGSSVPELLIFPIYSALPSEMQSLIFEPAPSRKVIIATNIAETSITIDNIYYVIDPGYVKQKAYDPKLGMDSLIITPISQAQAKQRTGRAGRVGPGQCYRLYTENAYNTEMLPSTIPDIQRQNVSETILMLKAMGINDVLGFDFMDPPPINAMLTALEELYALGALDDEGFLTLLGRRMTNFPTEPPLAKILLVSVKLGCSDEILSIVAMLNQPNVFYRPKEKQTQADQKKAKFHDPHGDHLTLLNVYNSWKQNGFSSVWCFENYIQMRAMKQAKNTREQLVKIMERNHHSIVSCGRDTKKVRLALCSSFFRNAARKDATAGAGCYKTIVEGTSVYLHPSSALFGKSAEWVVYHEVVLTSREYMHWCTSIEPKWLADEAPTFFKMTGTDNTMSKRRQQERIQPLYNKYATEDDWRLSAQRRSGRGGGGGTWG